MYRGRILAVVPPDTPREEIGLLMAGVTGEGFATNGSASDHEVTA
jgi:simple sugar transport system ATP-binding protein